MSRGPAFLLNVGENWRTRPLFSALQGGHTEEPEHSALPSWGDVLPGAPAAGVNRLSGACVFASHHGNRIMNHVDEYPLRQPGAAGPWSIGERSAEKERRKAQSPPNDDMALIAQALNGRQASFGELVQKYQDRLYNAVVHSMGNVEDARDVVQEAMVQAFLNLETFQHSSSFYTWLYRIAFNVRASHRRRKHATVSVEQAREATGEEPMDSGPQPSEQLQQKERCSQVWQAIAQLSEQHRAVEVLRDIEGFCYGEIAEILTLPVGTVRSRIHRARIQLRDILKGTMTSA